MKIRSVLAGAAMLVVLLPHEMMGQGFGGAVVVVGTEVLVGEPTSEREPGSVRIFRHDGGWTEAAVLRAPDAVVRDRFGVGLAWSGSTLFASAPDYADGVVHAFQRRDGRWRHIGEIRSPGLPDFGRTVAASGEHLLIGATERESERPVVAAYRQGAGGEWELSGRLEPSDADHGGLGTSMAIEGDLALIGAPTSHALVGAAYVFHHSSADGWHEMARLTPPGEAGAQAMIGASVAISEGDMFVGAPGWDRGLGAVHRFSGSPQDGWEHVEVIQPTDATAPAAFGAGIAVDGETALVGATAADRGAGRVYRLIRSGASWRVDGAWPIEGEGRLQAGGVLAAADGIAITGLPTDDFGAGSAWVSSEDGERATRLVSEQVGLPEISGGQVDCEDGVAEGFACDRVDLLAFLPREQMGAGRGARLNDVWGWTDPDTGREYALVGRMDGTAFVDVTDAHNPRYLGNLAKTEGSRSNTWRDMKVFKDHVFIVADGAGQHGMQVFDLERLRDVREPEEFEATALYEGIASVHNIAINEATGFAYLVGSSGGGETCGGGSHMVDINDPLNPTFVGCFAHPNTGRRNTGNTHDAQCVTYRGPDEEYLGHEICMNANETALSIADVSDKSNPVAVAQATYPSVSYAHQGWLTDDHRYFYSNDEADEVNGSVEATRTMVWDVRDLDDPLLVREYYSPTRVTDHNLYVRGDRLYMSNNRAGLRVLDISDPESPVEAGSFDTTPWSEDAAGFDGTWSVYPYFESGTILLSSRREGLFLVKPRTERLVP